MTTYKDFQTFNIQICAELLTHCCSETSYLIGKRETCSDRCEDYLEHS